MREVVVQDLKRIGENVEKVLNMVHSGVRLSIRAMAEHLHLKKHWEA
jgi:hypothetical protein